MNCPKCNSDKIGTTGVYLGTYRKCRNCSLIFDSDLDFYYINKNCNCTLRNKGIGVITVD